MLVNIEYRAMKPILFRECDCNVYQLANDTLAQNTYIGLAVVI